MSDLNPGDLIIQGYSGKHTAWTNTVPNGVRVIHKPTGTEVICERYRSQHQNKHEALNELRERLNGRF